MNLNNSTIRDSNGSQGGRRGISRNVVLGSLLNVAGLELSPDMNVSQKLSNSSGIGQVSTREQVQLSTVQRLLQEDALTFFRCADGDFTNQLQRQRRAEVDSEADRVSRVQEHVQHALDHPPLPELALYRTDHSSLFLDEWRAGTDGNTANVNSTYPRIIAQTSLFLLALQSSGSQFSEGCLASLQSKGKDVSAPRQNALFAFIAPLQQIFQSLMSSSEDNEYRSGYRQTESRSGTMDLGKTNSFSTSKTITSYNNNSHIKSPVKMLMEHILKTNEPKKDDMFSDMAVELTRTYLSKKRQQQIVLDEQHMSLAPPAELGVEQEDTDGFPLEDDVLLNTQKDVNFLRSTTDSSMQPDSTGGSLELHDKLIIHAALESHMRQYGVVPDTAAATKPKPTYPSVDLAHTVYRVAVTHFLRRLAVARLCGAGAQGDTLNTNLGLIIGSVTSAVFGCLEQNNAQDALSFLSPHMPETFALLDSLQETPSLPASMHPHNVFEQPASPTPLVLEQQKHALNAAALKELMALLLFQMEVLHMLGQLLFSGHKTEPSENDIVDLGDSLVQTCCTVNVQQGSGKRQPYAFFSTDMKPLAERWQSRAKGSTNDAVCENTLPPPTYSVLLGLAHAPGWMRPLTRIDLSENPLGDAGVLLLADTIPLLPCLVSLSLRGTECTGRSLGSLFQTLQGHPALEFLDVSSTPSMPNHIGPNADAATALGSLLIQTRTLHTLLLQDVGLGLQKGALSAFCIGLALNGSLHTLDLSKNYLNAKHLSLLSGALVHQRRAIAQFRVLQTAAAARLFAAVQKHQSKFSVPLPLRHAYEKHSWLQILLVPNVQLNISSIPEHLRTEVTQNSLLLSTQRLALCLALRSTYVQSSRTLQAPLEHNTIDPTSIVPAKAVLPIAKPEARPLATQLLSGNLFLSMGALPIIGLIKSGYPLHHLSLSECGIGTNALASLLQSASHNPLLITLDLRKNLGFRYNLNMGTEIENKYGGDSTQYSVYSNMASATKKNLLQSSQSSINLGSVGNLRVGETTLHQILSDAAESQGRSLVSKDMQGYIASLNISDQDTQGQSKGWLAVLQNTVASLGIAKQIIYPNFGEYIYPTARPAAFYLKNIPDPSILASTLQPQKSVSSFYYNKGRAAQDMEDLQRQQILLPVRSFPNLTLSPRGDLKVPGLARQDVLNALLAVSPLPTGGSDVYIVATELQAQRNAQIAVALHNGEEFHQDSLFDLRVSNSMMHWVELFGARKFLSGGPCGWLGDEDPFGVLDRTGNTLITSFTKYVPALRKYAPFYATHALPRKQPLPCTSREQKIEERLFLPDFEYSYAVKRLSSNNLHDIYVNATNQLLVTAGGTMLDLLEGTKNNTDMPSATQTLTTKYLGLPSNHHDDLLFGNSNTSNSMDYHKSILGYQPLSGTLSEDSQAITLSKPPVMVSTIQPSSSLGLLSLQHLPNTCIICGESASSAGSTSTPNATCDCDRSLLYDFNFIENSVRSVQRAGDHALLPLPLHDMPYYGLVQHPCNKKKETSTSTGIPPMNIFEKYHKTKHLNLGLIPLLKKRPQAWNGKELHEGLKQKNPTGLHVLDLSHTYCSSEVLNMIMDALINGLKKTQVLSGKGSTSSNDNNSSNNNSNDSLNNDIPVKPGNGALLSPKNNKDNKVLTTSTNNPFFAISNSSNGPLYMPISHLYLSYNAIDSKCLENIAQYIKQSSTLTHIDQSNNTFTQSAMNVDSEKATSSTVTTTITAKKPSSIMANTQSSSTKQTTNSALSNFKIIHDLSGVQYLQIALLSSRSLTHVNLNNCNLPDKVGLTMVMVLMLNPRLTQMHFEGNTFRPETTLLLDAALQQNRQASKHMQRRRKTWLVKALQQHTDKLRRMHFSARQSTVGFSQFSRPSVIVEEKYPQKLVANKMNIELMRKMLNDDQDLLEKQSVEEEIDYMQRQVTNKQQQIQTLFQDIPVLMDSENALQQQLQLVLQSTTALNRETREKGALLADGNLEADVFDEYQRDIAALELEIKEAEKVVAEIEDKKRAISVSGNQINSVDVHTEVEKRHEEGENNLQMITQPANTKTYTNEVTTISIPQLKYLDEYSKDSSVYQVHSTLFEQYKRVSLLKKKLSAHNNELTRNIEELTTKTRETLEQVPKANALYGSLEADLCRQCMQIEENMGAAGKNMRKCMKTLMSELIERGKNAILSSMTTRRVSPELESLFTCTFVGDKLATDVVLEIPLEEIVSREPKITEKVVARPESKPENSVAANRTQKLEQPVDKKRKKKSKALQEDYLPQKLFVEPMNIFSSLQRLN